jgi:hypothetical protein
MPEEEKAAAPEEQEETFYKKEEDLKPFEDKEEKETPADSPSEEETKKEEPPSPQGGEAEKEAEDTEAEEKPVPFHKHPRWRQMQGKMSQLEADKEELRIRLEERTRQPQPAQPEPIPAWFSGLYGDNAKAWQNFQAMRETDRQRVKKEIYTELSKAEKQMTAQEQARVKEHSTWLDNEIEALKAEGKKFDQNELFDAALRHRPTDDEGNISLAQAYEILQLEKAASKDTSKIKARKKVAEATSSDSKGETKPRNYKTPEDLKGGWPI